MRYEPWEVGLFGASNLVLEFMTQTLENGNISEYFRNACGDVAVLEKLRTPTMLSYHFTSVIVPALVRSLGNFVFMVFAAFIFGR